MNFPRVSILVTTRNRAEHLPHIFESLARTVVPPDLPAELLLMDNGSTDNTRQVFDQHSSAIAANGIEPRYLFVKEPGLCNGRNAGVQASRGEVIMITDDDLEVPPDWIEGLARPIVDGQAMAVAGGVRLAAHLNQEWMTDFHRGWLASTERDKREGAGKEPGRMVGASINVARGVFEKVPAFDPELGPGSLGFCDDILFSLQVKQAGFKILPRWEVEAEHHPDTSRLRRESLLKRARQEGESTAYLWHHWLHMPVRWPRLKAAFYALKLAAWRLSHRGEVNNEGCDETEMTLVQKAACHKHYLVEMKRPRNYTKRGLVKLEASNG